MPPDPPDPPESEVFWALLSTETAPDSYAHARVSAKPLIPANETLAERRSASTAMRLQACDTGVFTITAPEMNVTHRTDWRNCAKTSRESLSPPPATFGRVESSSACRAA